MHLQNRKMKIAFVILIFFVGIFMSLQRKENATTSELYTATLSVECGEIFENIDNFDSAKLDLLPDDGFLFPMTNVTFSDGESVFDVLLQEMQGSKIHMEYSTTPMYRSVYIEGIGNLYEFDCGALSGWIYSVNGDFPSYSMSQYLLSDGDAVILKYVCDTYAHTSEVQT